jgi:hypothetical protein
MLAFVLSLNLRGSRKSCSWSYMTQTEFELKQFQPSEYDRFAEIRDSIFPDDSHSAQELKSFDDNLDKTKYYLQRYSCFSNDTGEIVAFGELRHMPASP